MNDLRKTINRLAKEANINPHRIKLKYQPIISLSEKDFAKLNWKHIPSNLIIKILPNK